MQKYTGSVFRKFDSNTTGNIAVGSIVTVRKASDNTLATLYGVDNTSSVPLPNPLTTDVNGQYTFFAPNGKYNITFSDAATPALLGVQLLDLDEIAAKYITLEDFNSDAGNGGDDTAAWTAACASSIATGKTILLLDKTYLLTPNAGGTSFYNLSSLEGIGEAMIKCATSSTVADTSFLCDMVLPNGGSIKNVRFDGNLSADPVSWTSGNYNTWTGSRGPRLLFSTGVTIENIVVTNVQGPAFQDLDCENVTYNNCRSNRTRGNFGDGFNTAESKRVTYNNCYAYDFTRIGFVADKTSGDAGEHITYNNCVAEYGHDASILYSGAEYNSGFWHEFAVNITYNNCGAISSGEGLGRGFTCAIVFNDSVVETLPEIYGTTYNDCWVNGSGVNLMAGGFVISSLGNTRGVITLSNCHVDGTQLPYNLVGDRNLIRLVNCTSTNEQALLPDGVVRQSVIITGGDVEINGFREYINLPSGNWDALNGDEELCSIGSFSTDRPIKLTVKNLKSFQYDTKEQIPSRIQQSFSFERCDIAVEDAWLDQNTIVANSIDFTKVKFKTIGANVAPAYLKFTNCQFDLDNSASVGGQLANEIPTTGIVSFVDSFFNISGTDYLYLANNGVSNLGRVKIDNCVFRKNVETGGYIIRLNEAEGVPFDTSNLQWLDISNCRFINTGSTTANPIVFSDQRNTGGNTAVVRVFGDSNFKSSTITNNATTGVTTSQWTVTALT